MSSPDQGWHIWSAAANSALKAAAQNGALAAITVFASVAFVAGLALLTGLNPGLAVGMLAAVLAAGISVYRLWNGPIDLRTRQLVGRAATSGLIGFALIGLLIQAVPYGRDRTNPPVVAEPAWDSPRTRELAVVACFDCHSNEADYPWYSQVAPFSWAVQSHVEAGRSELNFSEWHRPQEEADESAETVLEGSMPPFYYSITHPAARLTPAEKRDLADGLAATLGVEEDD